MVPAKPDKFETTLGTYTTKSVLGEGGSGRVFLVEDSKGTHFAVKCLFPEMVTTERLGRFKNELQFSLKNTHPNILSILDYGYLTTPDGKTPFYVMRSYPSTLRRLLKAGLDPDPAYGLFLKILDGVEEAHRRGIWHRDLKPENVLVDPSTSALVVADFGIAHFSEDNLYIAVQTKQAERLANFQYAAPEQRIRGRQVGQRADIYALGLILNELLTGEVPLGTGFTRISQTAPAFSYLDDVVDRMIRQSPGQRPASINEIRLEITLRQQSLLTPPGARIQRTAGERPTSAPGTYRAEVDCIGRIDDPMTSTVLSISAGLSYSVSIPAAEKARALTYIAESHPDWGATRRHVLLHTILLYMLTRDHIRKLDVVVIDPEYPGYEAQIKDMLLRLLRNSGIKVRRDQIELRRIDRRSPARLMASRVHKGTSQPDTLLGAKQISELVPRRRSGP